MNTILMILDGWGIGKSDRSDVIFNARTPNIDRLKTGYPSAQLLACGEDVGLPDGQMGNSEVGHLNIGAGRIVYQDLVRINKAIRENTISENPVLNDAFNYAKKNRRQVHFIGLVSDGGVHSSDLHLYKLCELAAAHGLTEVFIHALMDGRDTDPHSGLGFIRNLEQHLKSSTGKIATVCGRYYTMDRDKRWERVKEGYDLMVYGTGEKCISATGAISKSYSNNVTDEFIRPSCITDEKGNPLTTIRENDVVICFNFRTDRLREITIALTQNDMPEFGMKTIPLRYYTMTRYDDTFNDVHIIYDKDNVEKTMGEIVSSSGLKQLRIAETEKYAHVTFFFSGGREEVFPGEDRILIPSPKVATYDLKPEMSAYEVKDAVIRELEKKSQNFICLNFANGDMVGHTGIYEAIRIAAETVDKCVGEVVECAVNNDYAIMIIADHGNADHAMNDDGSPNTAHSLNPVPCILINSPYKNIRPGILADVAPTLLTLMGLSIPAEMTGKVLVK
ncbi:MAG: 2,3-bisphosphoglycerate-independent phosphoglycerate mutase [Bacteroidota bacterium]